MRSLFLKAFFALFVVLLGAVFFWQPLSATFSNTSITNDFILQTAYGTLDSKSLRGKVLAIFFGPTNCGAPCTDQIAKLAQAREALNAGERSQVMVILITVDPERDTPVRMGEYARSLHADFVGASGKPEEIKAVADAFSADFAKRMLQDGSYVVEARPLTYLVDTNGRFVSVLNENLSAAKVAEALRARLPKMLPPG